MKNHKKLLKEVFNKASTYNKPSIPCDIEKYLTLVANNSERQKAVFTVLTTLLIHKILYPNQDIRLHQSSMKGGFSGRRKDTQFITPTLKELGLPSMSESGWLTRSLEQPHPYNLKYKGKIQNKEVKNAFLKIIDYIQKNPNKSKECSTFLIYSIREKFKDDIEIPKLKGKENFDIENIMSFLEECFNFPYGRRGGSKVPVIAIYSIFMILIKELERYRNCKLMPLGSHTASDITSKTSGDIEIFSASNSLEESIEIKFGKAIDSNLIRNIEDKIYKYKPRRYCVFSSETIEDKTEVSSLVTRIREKNGCHLILNGIIQTLRYYLRLISSKREFLNNFITTIQNDPELHIQHKKVIRDLKKKYFKKI